MSFYNNLLKATKPHKIESVTCDKCNYEMKQSEIKFKYEAVEKGVKRKYFQCPKCDTKYTIQYEDDNIYLNLGKMNDIRPKIQKLQSKIIKKKENNEIESLKNKIENLIKQYELLYCENLEISNSYKEKFESQ